MDGGGGVVSDVAKIGLLLSGNGFLSYRRSGLFVLQWEKLTTTTCTLQRKQRGLKVICIEKKSRVAEPEPPRAVIILLEPLRRGPLRLRLHMVATTYNEL